MRKGRDEPMINLFDKRKTFTMLIDFKTCQSINRIEQYHCDSRDCVAHVMGMLYIVLV